MFFHTTCVCCVFQHCRPKGKLQVTPYQVLHMWLSTISPCGFYLGLVHCDCNKCTDDHNHRCLCLYIQDFCSPYAIRPSIYIYLWKCVCWDAGKIAIWGLHFKSHTINHSIETHFWFTIFLWHLWSFIVFRLSNDNLYCNLSWVSPLDINHV